MRSTERRVRPVDIEAALSQIWDELEREKTRASLFNLIFYTPKNGRTDYFRKVAERVVETYPVRLIFISIDAEHKSEEIEARVSVIPSGDVACDLIQISLHPEQEERLVSIVLPNLMTDLPVYVVWGEDPSRKGPPLEIMKGVTRFIFDSESTDNLKRFATALLDVQKADITDLNWGRVELWRDLLAHTFDTPEHFERLKKTHTLTITYNADRAPYFSHTLIQALYFLGWLVSQLGWSVVRWEKRGDNHSFSMSDQGRSFEVILTPAHYGERGGAGTLVAVEIETESKEHYSWKRSEDDPEELTIAYSTKEYCALPFKMLCSHAAVGGSLVREVCRKGTSQHFVKVLEWMQTVDLPQ